MAQPPTPYPNISLNTMNPTTGERQLRRTPVGLRRMYPESEVSDLTTEPAAAGAVFPWFWVCGGLLLLLLLLGCAGAIFGIVFANGSSSDTTTTVFPSNETTTATTTPTTTISTTTPGLLCQPSDLSLDIFLLLDISRGLSINQYNLMINFLTNDFFKFFRIGVIDKPQPPTTRVALIPYSVYPKGQNNFEIARNTSELIGLLRFTKQSSDSFVNLGAALDYTKQVDAGNRPKRPDIVMVFISAASHDDAKPSADKLKSTNHTIITVSLGHSPTHMDDIASGSDDQFKVSDITKIRLIFNGLINALCRRNG